MRRSAFGSESRSAVPDAVEAEAGIGGPETAAALSLSIDGVLWSSPSADLKVEAIRIFNMKAGVVRAASRVGFLAGSEQFSASQFFPDLVRIPAIDSVCDVIDQGFDGSIRRRLLRTISSNHHRISEPEFAFTLSVVVRDFHSHEVSIKITCLCVVGYLIRNVVEFDGLECGFMSRGRYRRLSLDVRSYGGSCR